jgi:hypothetical protein
VKPVFSATALDIDLMSFDDGWKPLTADSVAKLWPILTATFGPRLSDQKKIRIAEQELAFLNDGKMLRLRTRRGLGQTTRYAMLFSDGTCLAIRYSHNLIENLVAKNRLHLNADTVADYAAFYWRFTEHGRSAREIDGDRPLSVEMVAGGIWQVTGTWHEECRSLPLNALVHDSGEVSFVGELTTPGSVTNQ